MAVDVDAVDLASARRVGDEPQVPAGVAADIENTRGASFVIRPSQNGLRTSYA